MGQAQVDRGQYFLEKVSFPHSRRSLCRPRLLSLLSEVLRKRVALIVAGAGYGKTTLVRDLVSSQPGVEFFWYRVDEGDSRLEVFVGYLLSSIQSRYRSFGSATLARIAAAECSCDPVELASTFTSDLCDVEDDIVMVIDDLHLVRNDPEIFSFLDATIARLPSNGHLVITSRTKLPLKTARLAAYGDAIVLSRQDLQFKAEEISGLCETEWHVSLSPDIAERLLTVTEGWAAGILMLGGLLAQVPEAGRMSFLEQVTSAEGIFDYLAEEVFNAQPGQIQDFLMKTSILNLVFPEVADGLLRRSDSASILGYLEDNNLFTSSVGSAYRYHQLFSQFLRERLAATLGPARLRDLHAHVARLFSSRGEFLPAVGHFIEAAQFAEAFQTAAEWFTMSPGMDKIAQVPTAASLDILASGLSRVPPGVLNSDPNAQYVLGRIASARDHYRAAGQHYKRAVAGYEAIAGQEALGELGTLGGRESPGDHEALEDRRIRGLKGLISALKEAMELLDALRNEARKERNPWAELSCLDALVMVMFIAGESKAGTSFYHQSQALGRELGRSFLDGQFLMAWSLYFLTGDIDRIREDLEAVEEELSKKPRDQDLLALASSLRAIIPCMKHDWERAYSALRELRPRFYGRASNTPFFSHLTSVLQRELGFIFWRRRNYREALQCFERNMEMAQDQPWLESYLACDLADLLMSTGDLAQAETLVSRALESHERTNTDMGIAMSAYRMAKLSFLKGDMAAAWRHLSRALSAIERQGYVHLASQLAEFSVPMLARFVEEEGALGREFRVLIRGMLKATGGGEAGLSMPRGKPAAKTGGSAGEAAGKVAGEAVRDSVTLRIQSFGGFKAFLFDRPIPESSWRKKKAQALLVHLLLKKGRQASKEEIYELLWPGLERRQAANNLRTVLHTLRRCIDEEPDRGPAASIVRSEGGSCYLADPARVSWDFLEFEASVRKGQVLLDQGNPEAYRYLLKAVNLYSGQFLPEPLFMELFCETRSWCEDRFSYACIRIAKWSIAEEKFEQAIRFAHRVISVDPAHEEAYRALMQAYAGLRQPDKVQKAFQLCKRRLARDLQSAPSEETVELLRRIISNV